MLYKHNAGNIHITFATATVQLEVPGFRVERVEWQKILHRSEDVNIVNQLTKINDY